MARPTAQKLTEAQKRPHRRKPNFLKGPPKRKSLLEAEQFEARAHALAESLGWSGDWDARLFDVQVKDARAYLQGQLHQAHVDKCNGTEPKKADVLCRHLGLEKDAASYEESLALVQTALDAVPGLEDQTAAN